MSNWSRKPCSKAARVAAIRAGKIADLIAVDGDPLSDIAVLQNKANIRLVMKEGRAYVDKISAQARYVLHPEPGEWKIIDNQ